MFYVCDLGPNCDGGKADAKYTAHSIQRTVYHVYLADFPAVFFHICNFDICHEILTTDKYKYQT